MYIYTYIHTYIHIYTHVYTYVYKCVNMITNIHIHHPQPSRCLLLRTARKSLPTTKVAAMHRYTFPKPQPSNHPTKH